MSEAISYKLLFMRMIRPFWCMVGIFPILKLRFREDLRLWVAGWLITSFPSIWVKQNPFCFGRVLGEDNLLYIFHSKVLPLKLKIKLNTWELFWNNVFLVKIWSLLLSRKRIPGWSFYIENKSFFFFFFLNYNQNTLSHMSLIQCHFNYACCYWYPGLSKKVREKSRECHNHKPQLKLCKIDYRFPEPFCSPNESKDTRELRWLPVSKRVEQIILTPFLKLSLVYLLTLCWNILFPQDLFMHMELDLNERFAIPKVKVFGKKSSAYNVYTET